MNSSLAEIPVQLPDVYEAAQFNREDLFAILEGLSAFSSGAAGRDPLASLGAAIEVIGRFASRCNVGTLQENVNKTLKWLTFGQQYAALEDSSDLDFDQLDVGSVPEVMKVIYFPLDLLRDSKKTQQSEESHIFPLCNDNYGIASCVRPYQVGVY